MTQEPAAASGDKTVPAAVGTKQAKLKHHCLKDLPATHACDYQIPFAWDPGGNRFIIVSDCQPLVQIVMGHSPLSSPTLAPPFHRISSHLVRLIVLGMRPHQQHLDPVIWRRREMNKKADYLVNYTMDTGASWTKVRPLQEFTCDLSVANWILYFDGGTRGDTCSCAAWILEAEWNDAGGKTTHLIAMAGTYLSCAVSSFVAELIALESCSETFFKLINEMHSEGSAGKRQRIV